MKKETGLKDDYGTPINDGDKVLWTYFKHGIMAVGDDGKETFLPCFTGGDMVVKKFRKTQKIKYEVRDGMAGYFLDRPSGISTTLLKNKTKCKVIKT